MRSFVAVVCTGAILFLSACTNHVSSPNKKTKKLSAGENSVFTPGNSASFTLQTVAPNPFNSNILNLVGDGSGDIGKYCIATSSGGATSYTCTCSFKYTRSHGPDVDWTDTNIIYREEDMLQCSRTIIHADAVNVEVRIHVMNSDSTSNEITLNFPTVFGGDTSNALNLVDVHRHQCRDAVFAPLPLLSAESIPVYDPFLSDDPTISYPLNFYYTNKGAALSSFVANPNTTPADVQIGNSGSVKVGWFCPSDSDYTHAQTDLNLFSVKPFAVGATRPPIASYDDSKVSTYWTGLETAGDIMAEPNSADPDFKQKNLRSDFVLSKKASGAFSMPVVAYVAPNTINSRMNYSSADAPPEPIGYGAVPTPKGDDQEACPTADEATIPTGYHWVKVWLARASLETRKTPVSEKLQISQLIQPPSDPNWARTQDCEVWNTGVTDSQNYRVIANTGACAYIDPNDRSKAGVSFRNTRAQAATSIGYANANPIIQNGTDPSMGPGLADKWQLATKDKNLTSVPAIGFDYRLLVQWVFGLLNDTPGYPSTNINPLLNAPITFKSADFSNVSGEIGIPASEVSYTPLEQNSRYDYLFVVTPTNIHSKHMIYPNTAEYENFGKYFIPFRVKSSEYFGKIFTNSFGQTGTCWYSDVAGLMGPQYCPEFSKIHYDIKLHGVQYQGDAPDPMENAGRLPVFPVCALQKD